MKIAEIRIEREINFQIHWAFEILRHVRLVAYEVDLPP